MNQKTKGILLCTVVCFLHTALADPTWWASRNVIDPLASQDDYAIATAGQLKHIATQAYDELLAKGHVCIEAANMVNSFINDDNYALINVGQLKNVANPLYECLGMQKPWTDSLDDDDNYALVNIGQLKHVFNFEISDADTDGDNLPDWWEMIIVNADPKDSINDIEDVLSSSDFDGDGVLNQDEYNYGLDPTSTNTSGDGIGDASQAALQESISAHGSDGILITIPDKGHYHATEPNADLIFLGE